MSTGFDVRSAAIALKSAVARGDVLLESLYGGAPDGPRIACPIHNGDGPNFEVYASGNWRCHSRCHGGGDVFDFVAIRDLGHVAGHPLRGDIFVKAVERTLEALGVDPSTFACARGATPPKGKKKSKPYPPADEVARLLAFAHELPVTGDPFALGGRERPGVGSCAVAAGLSLCVVLGPDAKKQRPKWAERWPDGKLFPLFDARGHLATVQLRPDDATKGKSKNPAKFNPTAYLMNEALLALLRGESADEKNRARLLGYDNAREAAQAHGVLITEGVPAFCAWSRWHAGPVGGLPGQDPSREWMAAIPKTAPVLLDFDPDLVGVGYLKEALAGLVHHNDVRVSARMRWIVERAETANRKPDAVAFALGEARKGDPALLDPDELVDGPRVERAGFLPLSPEERVEIVGKGDSFGRAWVGELRANEEGRVLATEGNLIGALKADERWLGVLGYDERAEKIVFLRRPPVADLHQGSYPRELRDEDASHVGAWYEAELAVEFGNAVIHRALLAAASLHRFDRVREYLGRAAATWDGTARIDTWLVDFFGAEDNAVTRAVGRKWLISAVARALSPGCKADHVLVLEGEQGAGKSSGLAALCPDPDLFLDAIPNLHGGKETSEYVSNGAWIIELAELDAIAKSESSAVKAFLTRRDDPFRPAYGRYFRQHPRRVVFCASTNDATYLRDTTGNRRFWPVKISQVAVDRIAEARTQLWGEAVLAYRAGEAWHVEDAAIQQQLVEEQDGRRETDPWELPIGAYLEEYRELAMRHRGRGNVLRIEDMPARCLDKMGVDVVKTSRADARRVNAVLRTLGWDRLQRRDSAIKGRRRWAWEPLDRWIHPGVTSSGGGVTSCENGQLVTENGNDFGGVTSVTSVTGDRARAQAGEVVTGADHHPSQRSMGWVVSPGDTGDSSGDGGGVGDGVGESFGGDDDGWGAEKCADEVRW